MEMYLVEKYAKDPDFDRWYTLSAILSLISTPLPNVLTELKIPMMFLVPVRGFTPSYVKDLYNRLPSIKKRLVEVDGGIFWFESHLSDAAKEICKWFDEML